MKSSQEKLNDYVAFGSLPLETVSLLDIDMVDFAEARKAWDEYCEKLEKEFPITERKELAQKILKESIAFGENKIKELKKQYDESRRKGKPYEERKDITVLFEYIKERIRGWYDLGRAMPQPLKEVLLPDDYPRIKELGIKEWFTKYAIN